MVISQTLSVARASLAAFAVLGGSLLAGGAMAQTPTSGKSTPAAPKPKVSAKQAEAVAVKKIGGKALSAKYEFEDGHWQYAVIVKNKKGELYEVAVNSTTSAVLNTEKTSVAEEAKEEADDKKKAAGGKVK